MDSLRLIGIGGLRVNENQARTAASPRSCHNVAIRVSMLLSAAYPDTLPGLVSGFRNPIGSDFESRHFGGLFGETRKTATHAVTYLAISVECLAGSWPWTFRVSSAAHSIVGCRSRAGLLQKLQTGESLEMIERRPIGDFHGGSIR